MRIDVDCFDLTRTKREKIDVTVRQRMKRNIFETLAHNV
jgi:hypothetical protein